MCKWFWKWIRFMGIAFSGVGVLLLWLLVVVVLMVLIVFPTIWLWKYLGGWSFAVLGLSAIVWLSAFSAMLETLFG